MRVCLYLEGNLLLRRSGIGVALERQKKALEKAGVEYTTNPLDDYDILHINTIFPKSLFYTKLAKEKGRKVIIHAHTLEEDTRNSFVMSNTLAPVFKRYLKFFYGQADHIICPSEYTKNQLKKYGLKQSITTVSNGVDLDRFRFSKRERQEYRERYGMEGMVPFSVGHVFMRKGVRTFIEVARSFENQFIWFGNVFRGGLARNKELDEALESKPDNVRFTGYVNNIVAAYSAGDIFFFPSLAETQGIVILEAWAMGRPVLIRDLPVFRDWTRDGKDCLRAKTDEEFEDYLRQLIEDGNMRKRLIRNGLESVKEHSLEKVGMQLKEVYEVVLNEG